MVATDIYTQNYINTSVGFVMVETVPGDSQETTGGCDHSPETPGNRVSYPSTERNGRHVAFEDQEFDPVAYINDRFPDGA